MTAKGYIPAFTALGLFGVQCGDVQNLWGRVLGCNAGTARQPHRHRFPPDTLGNRRYPYSNKFSNFPQQQVRPLPYPA